MGMIGNSLAQGLISGANIQDGTVDTPDIKDSAVTAAKIAADAVVTGKILDANVTPAKLSTGAPTWDSSGNLTSTSTGIITSKILSTGTNTAATLTLDAKTTTGTSAVTGIYFNSNTTAKWALGGGNVGSAGSNDFSLYNYATSTTIFNILSSNGNIGFNQSSPTLQLDIQNRADLSTAIGVNNQSGNANYAATMLFNNTGPGVFYIGRASATTGYLTTSIGNIGASNTGIWNSAATKMYFGTNNATAFYIDTDQATYFSGTVRIPVLGVYTGTSGAGNMSFECTNSGSLGKGYCGINAYTNGVFALGSASGSNLPVEFYTNGGIGARLTAARGNGGYRLLCSGNGVGATGSNYAGGLSAGMSNTNALGLNGRNPSVVISGNYNSTAGAPQFCANWASGGAWGLGPDTGTNDSYLRFGLWGEDADGFYWTGTYNNIKANAFTPTSDYRIKENVRPFDRDALALLRQFNPVIYNKRYPDHDDEAMPQSPDEIGYLAHQAQEIVPELVTGHKDEVDTSGNMVIQGMNYDRMSVLFQVAIGQLEDKLAQLQGEFTAYKEAHP